MGTGDDKKKFAILMAMLGTAFGEKGISPDRIEIYWAHLNDIPVDTIAVAVKRIIKTRKFSSIPTIAEIREAALGRDEDIETAALLAWGQACRAVERGKDVAGDAVVDEAVRVAFGGWAAFGQTDPEQAMADRAHFLRVFKGIARRRRESGAPALEAGTERRALRAAQTTTEE